MIAEMGPHTCSSNQHVTGKKINVSLGVEAQAIAADEIHRGGSEICSISSTSSNKRIRHKKRTVSKNEYPNDGAPQGKDKHWHHDHSSLCEFCFRHVKKNG